MNKLYMVYEYCRLGRDFIALTDLGYPCLWEYRQVNVTAGHWAQGGNFKLSYLSFKYFIYSTVLLWKSWNCDSYLLLSIAVYLFWFDHPTLMCRPKYSHFFFSHSVWERLVGLMLYGSTTREGSGWRNLPPSSHPAPPLPFQLIS